MNSNLTLASLAFICLLGTPALILADESADPAVAGEQPASVAEPQVEQSHATAPAKVDSTMQDPAGYYLAFGFASYAYGVQSGDSPSTSLFSGGWHLSPQHSIEIGFRFGEGAFSGGNADSDTLDTTEISGVYWPEQLQFPALRLFPHMGITLGKADLTPGDSSLLEKSTSPILGGLLGTDIPLYRWFALRTRLELRYMPEFFADQHEVIGEANVSFVFSSQARTP